jgi:hypothetical protein
MHLTERKIETKVFHLLHLELHVLLMMEEVQRR